ncbi:MAG: 16S rRNA (cytosine(967)-C(5))-methyltransferase RsmB [Clostridia bacterium]|nr:16S rRNA (cytosine(967)-C(5))-methyltransferase RsmB [Clostridia bacterium]
MKEGRFRENRGVTPARALALEALMDVFSSDAYSTLTLDRRLKAETRMSDPDRRLATELFYGVLERKIQLDYILNQRMEKDIGDLVVQNILRLGAYQILFMDRIPASAAVSQAVEQTRRKDREALCPVVNGVLRNLVRGKNQIEYPQDLRERLHILYSMPLWLVDKLLASYPEETAEAILRAEEKEHPICVRYHAWLETREGFEAFLSEKQIEYKKSVLPRSYVVSGAPMARFAEYRQGRYSIQSEASMLSAMAVGARRGMQVLDICAAPGGKTCFMAEEMQNTGRVYAWDIHPHRVELIRASAKRLALDNVRPREHDAVQAVPDLFETMDAVLVDAPCSGTGETGNKPDIKYRLTEEGVRELSTLQEKILSVAWQYVRIGGALVYSTCSVLPEENEQVVRAFLASHPQFVLRGMEKKLPAQYAERIHDGMLQLLPQTDGEGFFIVRMERTGA